MLGFLLVMLIIGAVAGFIARAVVPGPDPMGVLGTIVLGVVGSFVGGFLGYLLFGKDAADGALQPAGLLGAIIGAIVALLVYRSVGGRSRTHAGVSPHQHGRRPGSHLRPRPHLLCDIQDACSRA
jgi:uncharacterized membrane protein YeaQ/YmgE (transglycosylase-associated protein family)